MKYSNSIFSTVCGLLLLCTPYSVLAETSQQVNNQINNIDHLAIAQPDILENLTQAQIIYLGEQHDRLADHHAQLEIIKHLHQKSGKIAIALEMFQKPYQQVINDYLAEKISETELIEKTEY
ncbi:MAG: ChaN family lipoprotein, partial [Microcoleaceae cyanobacterium]